MMDHKVEDMDHKPNGDDTYAFFWVQDGDFGTVVASGQNVEELGNDARTEGTFRFAITEFSKLKVPVHWT